ncbi:aminotransferase [Clostridium tetani]|uniref:Aminotransferase n=1 Tax=Clostridium tetani TaxID=1513 RepID=A0A4Q0VCM1_CLOTA|nr:pyridoxal phosphate-dependent aminotransferase [Clostridium tetani]CDI49412.1 aspartate aminotransferase [Clostridium tetani 12124569]RXI47544.1 pyridoxal phosphate-dependent aminotransferase [Clostridium tetani]BDR67030.1 aminotransferase [Clostridium tetani]BDR69684.1 aminotransferase [Clostridium tetani]BDR72442.1 aminotransferase [Clostridium tetani]
MLGVSKRVEELRFSEIRKFIPYSDGAKAKGVQVHHLNIGQPDIKTPEEFISAIKNFDEEIVKYEDSQGNKDLIDAFVKYYESINIDIDKEDVYITNGGSEAILYALLTICDLGDSVIVPEPYYTNYNTMAKMAGVDIISFRTYREDGFRIKSKEDIINSIKDNTKAIMITNPSNPTGVVYTKEEIRMISDIAKEKDLFIISDEVYREFVYDDFKFTSFMDMKDILDRVIIIDSISKRYSACGARIGALICKNRNVTENFMKMCQARLSVSSLDQVGAANLINVPKSYIEEVRIEYEKRRNILYEGLCDIPGVHCEKPSGAFYIIAKLPIDNSDDFTKWMLKDFQYNNKTVMVTPAEGFYTTEGLGKDEVRLSYCINSQDLKESMLILKKALEEYNKLRK